MTLSGIYKDEKDGQLILMMMMMMMMMMMYDDDDYCELCKCGTRDAIFALSDAKVMNFPLDHEYVFSVLDRIARLVL